MCPACITTAALLAAGASRKGRLAALAQWLRTKAFRPRPRPRVAAPAPEGHPSPR